MLTKITIERFKSLSKVELSLGQLNLFIGTNASGKSNLFDALRVLQGVGYGFTVAEILDGKPKGPSSIAWDGIRGGSAEAVLKAPLSEKDIPSEGVIRLAVQFRTDAEPYEYEIELNPLAGTVRRESLSISREKVYETTLAPESPRALSATIYPEGSNSFTTGFDETLAIINQMHLIEAHVSDLQSAYAARCAVELADLQQLELVPSVLRQYSQSQSAKRLGEHGENFAALVQTICANKQARAEYVSWLRELTPAEVDDVVILKGAVNEPLFALREGKHTFPAQVLSDGTLRFSALAAALFQPDAPGLLLLEEIENGIHPTRLRLLVELLRSRAQAGKPQVLATTHSPIVLAWLKPEEYAHTFFCLRDERGISHIQPVSSLPQFESIVKRTPISDLFAEGWLESVL